MPSATKSRTMTPMQAAEKEVAKLRKDVADEQSHVDTHMQMLKGAKAQLARAEAALKALQAPAPEPASTPADGTCPDCGKTYKNLKLHMVKTHQKFLCMYCKEWKPTEGMVSGIAGKNEGKNCHHASCEDCWN